MLTPTATDRLAPTAERILDTAARLFAANGYKGTTLREIADAVGMKAGSIYYHFDSKEEIIARVFDTGVQRVFNAARDAVESLPPDASTRDRVQAAATGHLKAFFVLGGYTTTNIRVFRQAPPAVQEQNRKLRDAYEQYWMELLETGRERGEVREDLPRRVVRLFLFGALNWTVEWYHEEKMSLEELAAVYTSILFDGVDPR